LVFYTKIKSKKYIENFMVRMESFTVMISVLFA